jgi:hypothetical protein
MKVNRKVIIVVLSITLGTIPLFISIEKVPLPQENTRLWNEKMSRLKPGDDFEETQKIFESDIDRKNQLFGFTFLKLNAPANAVDTPYLVFEKDGKLVFARFNRHLSIGKMPARFDSAVDSAVLESMNLKTMKVLGVEIEQNKN